MLQTALKTPLENAVANTPADLRALRMLLGLSQEQVATLIGVHGGEARQLERMRTHFIYRGHIAVLEGMLTRVNSLLADNVGDDVPAPEFLFCYPNDDVFREMEPDLAAWMVFNTVHLMYLARLLDEWMQRDHRPVMVEIIPQQYREFLDGIQGNDSLDNRIAWAHAHMKVITFREGLPGDPRRDRERRP